MLELAVVLGSEAVRPKQSKQTRIDALIGEDGSSFPARRPRYGVENNRRRPSTKANTTAQATESTCDNRERPATPGSTTASMSSHVTLCPLGVLRRSRFDSFRANTKAGIKPRALLEVKLHQPMSKTAAPPKRTAAQCTLPDQSPWLKNRYSAGRILYTAAQRRYTDGAPLRKHNKSGDIQISIASFSRACGSTHFQVDQSQDLGTAFVGRFQESAASSIITGSSLGRRYTVRQDPARSLHTFFGPKQTEAGLATNLAGAPLPIGRRVPLSPPAPAFRGASPFVGCK
ncbi:hypothetical protein TgHK011_006747 [Trichoderma gracile]|nr:hypothetical protein TgHK011_006747 [Trichoderma gracile]